MIRPNLFTFIIALVLGVAAGGLGVCVGHVRVFDAQGTLSDEMGSLLFLPAWIWLCWFALAIGRRENDYE